MALTLDRIMELVRKHDAIAAEIARLDEQRAALDVDRCAVKDELEGRKPGRRATAKVAPALAVVAATPVSTSSAPPWTSKEGTRAERIAAELRDLRPFYASLTDHARKCIDLRATGKMPEEIAKALKITTAQASQAIYTGTKALRAARQSGAKPKADKTAANDSEDGPAAAPAIEHPTCMTDGQRAEPEEQAPTAPTSDIVHLWSPDSGGTPACGLPYDPNIRMMTDADAVTCQDCAAANAAKEPGAETYRPPAWALRWLMPEVRRAYEQVVLGGISMQTAAWFENVKAAVISGRVNGARSQIHRLLRWEDDREREGTPLTDRDREPPEKYSEAAASADPLLAILGRPEAAPEPDIGKLEVPHVTRMSDSGADGRASAPVGSGTADDAGAAIDSTSPLSTELPDLVDPTGRKPGEIDPDEDLSEFFPDDDQVADVAAANEVEEQEEGVEEVAELRSLAHLFGGLTVMQRQIVEARVSGKTTREIGGGDRAELRRVSTMLGHAKSTLRRLQANGYRPPAYIVPPPDVEGELLDPPALAKVRAKSIENTPDDRRARGYTIANNGKLTRDEITVGKLIEYPQDVERPATRADCKDTPRPCPFVSCRHHLYLDVNEDSGAIRVNFPQLEVWEMRTTCVLDVADAGGVTLEEVGAIMNVTRERVRQIETRAFDVAERNIRRKRLPLDLPDDVDNDSPMAALQRAS